VLAWLVIWACVVLLLISTTRSTARRSNAQAADGKPSSRPTTQSPAEPSTGEEASDIATGDVPAGSFDQPTTAPAAGTSTDATLRPPGLPQRLSLKYMVGVGKLMGSATAQQSIETASAQAQTPLERLSVVTLIGELEGGDKAIAALNALNDDDKRRMAREIALLRRIYTPDAKKLAETDRDWLESRLGYAGELATVYGLPMSDPDRQRVMTAATSMMAVFLGVLAAATVGTFGGIALLILAGMSLRRGRLKLRYAALAVDRSPLPPVLPPEPPAAPPMPPAIVPPPAPPPHAWGDSALHAMPGMPMGAPMMFAPYTPPPPLPRETYHLGPLREVSRTGPFIEAFAIYLGGYLGVSLLVSQYLPREMGLPGRLAIMLLPVVIGLLWPRLRGVPWRQWRVGFGFVLPGGIFRELGAGIVGYIAGLPLAALAMIIVLILTSVTGLQPSHPINESESAGSLTGVLFLYLAAAVWAPITEEAFFRGALFHRLRRGWGWLLSALISSFIFAAVHPQGWTVIPALAALAIVFCGIREWRGNTIASMAAHALHNGTLVTVLIVAAS
jgi:membrane protease YdiL (CAAX protease family)